MNHTTIGFQALFIIGGPGSGKTCATDYFVKRGFQHVESSDQLKRMTRENDQFKHENDINRMKNGKPYSDKSVRWALEEALKMYQTGTNFVFTGYMRTSQQVTDALDILETLRYGTIIISFDCSFETCIRRIAKRVQENLEHNASAGHEDQRPIRDDDRGLLEVLERIDFFERNISDVLSQIKYRSYPVNRIDAEKEKKLVLRQVSDRLLFKMNRTAHSV